MLNISRRLAMCGVVIASFLLVVSWLIIEYQAHTQAKFDIDKSEVVSRQVASRLDVFVRSGEHALTEVSRNWPENHPNLEQWFTKLSLNILGILPEFEHVWFVDSKRDLIWQVPATSSMKHEQFKESFDNLLTKQVQLTSAFALPNGHIGLAVAKPVHAEHQFVGWVLGVIDVNRTLSSLVVEDLGNAYAFSLIDENNVLFQHGQFPSNQVPLQQDITVVDRTLSIHLGYLQTTFNKKAYWLFAIIINILLTIVSLFALSNWTRAMTIHRQFNAASQASLDGLMIFSQQNKVLTLTQANAVATEMLALQRYSCKDYTEFLAILGFSEEQELNNAPKAVMEGKSFDQSLPVLSQSLSMSYIKLQMVNTQQGIAVTIRDISARKQIELDLREREAKYRRLVDGLHGYFLYTANTAGQPEFVSKTVENILGYQSDFYINHFDSVLTSSTINLQRESVYREMAMGKTPEPYLLECHNSEGEVRLIEFTDSPVFRNNQFYQVEGIARDVTDEKALADKVTYQAEHDFLTGLYNRYAFEDILKATFEQRRKQGLDIAICYLDLDQFKVVNDTCGHMAGDELLKQLGTLIQNNIDEHHIVGRLGGDEFGIIFINNTITQAEAHLKDLLEALNQYRFVWQERSFQISASIGLTEVGEFSTTDEVLKQADVACYVAKDSGRNRIHVYNEQDVELNYHQSRINWVSKIQQALDEDRFELHYQRIEAIDNSLYQGLHYEVLLRMVDVDNQLISPAMFIPAAERFDLMEKIDLWVIQRVIQHLSDNPALLAETSKCAINLSGRTITDVSTAENIIKLLTQAAIPAEKICFEITETAAVSNLSQATEFIQKLRDYGCSFALDDFGVGMCSFSYLKNLPVDFIKIDGSFVQNIRFDNANRAIVSAINDIARSLGKLTIAEFVADEPTQMLLRDLGINYAQGFAIAKPQPFLRDISAERVA